MSINHRLKSRRRGKSFFIPGSCMNDRDLSQTQLGRVRNPNSNQLYSRVGRKSDHAVSSSQTPSLDRHLCRPGFDLCARAGYSFPRERGQARSRAFMAIRRNRVYRSVPTVSRVAYRTPTDATCQKYQETDSVSYVESGVAAGNEAIGCTGVYE